MNCLSMWIVFSYDHNIMRIYCMFKDHFTFTQLHTKTDDNFDFGFLLGGRTFKSKYLTSSPSRLVHSNNMNCTAKDTVLIKRT